MLKSLESNSLGTIYYIITYVGSIMGMKGKTSKESRDLVTFKRANKPSNMIPDIIKMAINEIDAKADICVIPSSKPKLNNLQKALQNTSIVKLIETEPRKQNHAANIPNNFKETIEVNHTKKSNTLIIVDDIITSGKTMAYFVDLMSVFKYDKIHVFAYGITDTFIKRYDKTKSVSMFEPCEIFQSNIPDIGLMIPTLHFDEESNGSEG